MTSLENYVLFIVAVLSGLFGVAALTLVLLAPGK
jgi:hypothetical protein